MIIFLICLVVHLQEPSSVIAAGEDHQSECEPTRCKDTEPIVRFPFRLKDRQPKHCGYPGFDLSCNSNNNNTEFEFQFPVRASARNIILPITAKATVTEIDYKSQLIRVFVFNGSSLPNQLPQLNSSASPFQIYTSFSDLNFGDEYDIYTYGYTLLNCSTRPRGYYVLGPVLGLDHHGGFQVYADPSADMFDDLQVSICVKMYNISYVPEVILGGMKGPNFDDPQLHWSKPSCGSCEVKGNYCRFKNNGANNETECYETPEQARQKKKGVSKIVVIAVVVVAVFVMLLLAAALYSVYSVKKRKRDNQRKIEHFLEDYQALRQSRYTYSDIKKITDGFKYKLGQGGYGTVFKGKLSNEILVAVKVLNTMKGNGDDFINEVGTIGKIHHVNVVRLIGYCADGYRRALVYEFLENSSLQKYISSGNKSSSLGWEKLHEIALGIAKGLDYLHQGCNQRILHFDIKPHNILLDHNLNPKVADFGLAKLCSKDQSMVTMTAARGTIGYIAPEVFSRNFGNVSYKSDIYSYGMLLLDMVGGRKKFFARAEESDDQAYFPEWIYNQLEKGEEIAIEIEKREESDIVRRLTIVGLWCIQWYPADRPSTRVVIQMLEGENMPIMPLNPFDASDSVNTNSIFGESVCSSTQTSFE